MFDIVSLLIVDINFVLIVFSPTPFLPLKRKYFINVSVYTSYCLFINDLESSAPPPFPSPHLALRLSFRQVTKTGLKPNHFFPSMAYPDAELSPNFLLPLYHW